MKLKDERSHAFSYLSSAGIAAILDVQQLRLKMLTAFAREIKSSGRRNRILPSGCKWEGDPAHPETIVIHKQVVKRTIPRPRPQPAVAGS